MTTLTVDISDEVAKEAAKLSNDDLRKTVENAIHEFSEYAEWQHRRFNSETRDLASRSEAKYQERKASGYSKDQAKQDVVGAINEIQNSR